MPKLVDSSWYMVNISWVKNVNNGFITTRISGVLSSTVYYIHLFISFIMSAQARVIHSIVLFFTHGLSTAILVKTSLLNTLFTQYPQDLLLERFEEN